MTDDAQIYFAYVMQYIVGNILLYPEGRLHQHDATLVLTVALLTHDESNAGSLTPITRPCHRTRSGPTHSDTGNHPRIV